MDEVDEFGPLDEYSLGWKIAPEEPHPDEHMKQSTAPVARVFGFSDLHVDYRENYGWCEELSPTDFQGDVLLLAGDLTNDLAKLRAVLTMLRSKFAEVFFVPGNHDVWVRRQQPWQVAPQNPLEKADQSVFSAMPTDSPGQLAAV